MGTWLRDNPTIEHNDLIYLAEGVRDSECRWPGFQALQQRGQRADLPLLP
jgi:hypothetical protein